MHGLTAWTFPDEDPDVKKQRFRVLHKTIVFIAVSRIIIIVITIIIISTTIITSTIIFFLHIAIMVLIVTSHILMQYLTRQIVGKQL